MKVRPVSTWLIPALFLLISTSAFGQQNHLFRGPFVYPIDPIPETLTAADFNGDGKLDLATANGPSNTMGVLLNTGKGFQPVVNYPAGNFSDDVATGDFDRDGNIDVITANNLDSTASLFFGNGDGTFAPAVQLSVPAYATSVVVADLNVDGKLDLVIGGFTEVDFFLGNGDGTFAPPSPLSGGREASVIGDFNNDGKLDIVTGSNVGIDVFLGRGNGTFRPGKTYDSPRYGPGIAVDLNGDGKLDLASLDGFHVLCVNFGNGDGSFQPPQTYAVGNTPLFLTAGDFNNDGYPDLAVTVDLSMKVVVLINDGGGTFKERQAYGTNGNAFGITAADLNGDGKLDLAIGTGNLSGEDSISVFLGTSKEQILDRLF